MLLNHNDLVLGIRIHDPRRRRLDNDGPIPRRRRRTPRHGDPLPRPHLHGLGGAHMARSTPSLVVVVMVAATTARAHLEDGPLDGGAGHDARAEAQAAVEEEEEEEEAADGAEDDAGHDARVGGGVEAAVDGGDGDEVVAVAA